MVESARDLQASDTIGKSDPFVKVGHCDQNVYVDMWCVDLHARRKVLERGMTRKAIW